MKDFFGVEVDIGDDVVTTAKNYRSLVRGKIISISPKSVVVEYLNTWNYGLSGNPETYRVAGDQFIKVVK